MPGRRSRKRKRPLHVNVHQSQDYLFFSEQRPPNPALPTQEQQQTLAVVSHGEEEANEKVPTVSLLDQLIQILPPQLGTAVNSNWPFLWPRYLKKSVPFLSSSSLLSPSFCIGRFSLSLMTSGLRDLLSLVHLTEPQLKLSLLPYGCDDWGYLELSREDGESVYILFTASPPFSEWCHCLKSTGVYRTQLVLKFGERERKCYNVEQSSTSDSGMGDSESGGDGEMKSEANGTTTCGVGVDVSLGGLSSDKRKEQAVLVGGEGGGGVNEQTGEVGSGAGARVCEGDGDCESVCVDVWVGGGVCVPSDPNSEPLGGNMSKLTHLVRVLHPGVMIETTTPTQSLWLPAGGQSVSIASRIGQFYTDVKQRQRELCGATEPEYDTSSIPGLTAELRGYQKKAVQWMLDREKGVEEGEDLLHPLWRELSVPSASPSTLYYNPHTGRLSAERYPRPPLPLGGILADEMGLGKTVEVLALLMAHRAPNTTSSGDRKNNGLRSPSLSPTKPTNRRRAISSSPGVSQSAQPGGEDREEVVQCVCGATSEDGGEDGEEGREYVQCERCKVWLHSHCVSFNSTQHPTFVCIKCLLEEPLQSKATLIISPESILQQWREEINKHTSQDSLSVLHYEGVKYGFVSPYDLADSDVVLVSYETLSLELNYAKSHEFSRVLRHRKRYTAAPSPLPAVHWWRVCLDEAQMVESAVTKPAEMCLRLHTTNKWCVTGTPIQRDLNDLYGLVLFLDMQPYSQSQCYRRLITQPYLRLDHEPLVTLYSSLMWRNTKEEVAHELQLPAHTEHTHFLTFSLVESFFYRKQREMCRTETRKVLSRLSDCHTLGSLTQNTVQKVMAPLHSLRRACCHPQMVRRGAYIHLNQKKSLTMPQLLEKLVMQAKVEAREALRKLILSLNGLAGLYILKEKWREALEAYGQALNTWEEYKEKEVECDKLQRIHTLENLSWLVEQEHCSPEDLSRLCIDVSTLGDKVLELRDQFLGKIEEQTRTAVEAVMACKRASRESWTSAGPPSPPGEGVATSSDDQDEERMLEDIGESSESASDDGLEDGCSLSEDSSEDGLSEDGCSLSEDSSEDGLCVTVWKVEDATSLLHLVGWMGLGGEWVKNRGQEAVDQLLAIVNSHFTDSTDILGRQMMGTIINAVGGIHFIVATHLEKIQKARSMSLEDLDSLVNLPTKYQVHQAHLCHLALNMEENHDGLRLRSCQFCTAESKLVEYGSHLFSNYTFSNNSMGLEHGEGSRGTHTFEKIIRSFLAFLRHKRAPRELLDAGKTLVAFIEAIKKEYDALRSLWQSLCQRVALYDELRLASSRMHYITPMEVELGIADPSAVHRTSWPVKKEEFEVEKTLAHNELTRSLGQIMYLNNLAKASVSEGDCESCPICTRLLGKEIEEWGMLPCGHPLCMDCVLEMSRVKSHAHFLQRGTESVTVRLSCPLCRFSFLSSEINTVRPFDHEDIDIKGSLSTKMRGVVQTLQTIQSESPTAKTLVFSSWAETLTLVSESLTENGITHSFPKTPKTFQGDLCEFKRSPNINVLLLPLHSGSKGLNIVEATHVVLAEPGLNVGAELQAIGRIHRMGQTQPTTVHRLVIRDSVEENIHHLLGSSHDQTKHHTRTEGESTLTLRELETLFN